MINKNKKWALITGASSGIGYEIAKILANKGYNLILASRNIDKMKELEQEFSSVDVVSYQIDLSEPNSANILYSTVKNDGYNADILINNSGFGLIGKFFDYEPNRYFEMMQLNMVSLTMLTRLFAKDMAHNGGGYIMNVASTASFKALPTFGVYSATKSFVRNMSLSLYHELKEKNVNIISVNPGPTSTNFGKVAMKGDDSKFFNYRITMTAEDVAIEAVQAMFDGKIEVTTGFINKFNKVFLRLVPIKLIYLVMKKYMKLD